MVVAPVPHGAAASRDRPARAYQPVPRARSGLTGRMRAMVLLRLTKQPGGFCVPGWRFSYSARCADRTQLAPTGVCPVGLFVSPPHDASGQTRPAPRCPVRRAGRLTALSIHRRRASGACLIGPAGDAQRYQITIRGECGRLLISLIDNVQVVPSRDGTTSFVALVRDDPEFWALLEQLRDLALHVVSLQDLEYGNGEATAP